MKRWRFREKLGDLIESQSGELMLFEDHEAIIKRQASAALAGMNAAKAISSNDVQRAARLRAESSPDALESERQANAKLTQELSLAEEGLANYAQENGQLRAALKGLSDMYARTWDRVDGALVMMPDRVSLFEETHRQAFIALGEPVYDVECSSEPQSPVT